MNEIKSLAILELRNFYGINRFRHTSDKKEKNRYGLLGAAWILLICMMVSYVVGLVFGLTSLGLKTIVPVYLVFITSFLIFTFGIFKAGNTIFAYKGYDILVSLPIKTSSIVISRFLSNYVGYLALTIIIMLPGIITFGVLCDCNIGFYIVSLIGTLFIPAIPLVLSTLVGTIITAISSRMKHKSMIQTILMVVFLFLMIIGSFGMQNFSTELSLEKISAMATTLGMFLEKIYYPAVWLGDAIYSLNIEALLLFILVSTICIVITIIIVSRNFHKIMSRLMIFSANYNYKIESIESRSLIKTLYFRELKRYFSSSVYTTNTIIGPVIGCILSVLLCVTGVDVIKIPVAIDINGFIPLAIAAIFCTMTTTSVSISMEGKQFWAVKSLPISSKMLFDGKILLNLSLITPFYFISTVCLIIATRPNIIELIWLVVIPLLLILFSVVLGITVNLKFNSFDWEREEVVVKQSLSSMIGCFAGIGIALIFAVILFMIPIEYINIVKTIMCILIFFGTFLLYRKNNTAELSKL